MELHKVIGDLIVQHRFSKRQICETLGVTRVTLNSYLSGSVSPSVDLLVRFLNLLRPPFMGDDCQRPRYFSGRDPGRPRSRYEYDYRHLY